jgi:alkyl hydroperoxide reductase subunit AhpC
MSDNKILKAGRPSEKKKVATLSALADKSDTVRVNFDLDREEHIKLKIYAAKAGKRVSEVLRELIAGLDS